MKAINRDPFARETMFRETIFTNSKTCSFCGNVRTTKTGKKYLYQYSIEQDGIYTRPIAIKGLFCGVSCCRAYNQ